MKRTIVIGSGFGGLSAALRMRAKGHDVTLIEKQPDLGGRARTFERDGFIYDGGPTVITAPYLFQELFALFNKRYEDYFTLIPLDVWYRFVFSDHDFFDYSGNTDHMVSQIRSYSNHDVDGYTQLVSFTKTIFDKGYTELSDVPFNQLWFMIKQLPTMFKLRSYRSVFGLVSQFISHPKLRKVFSMHPLLVGGNPFTTTSIYALILYLEQKWGIHYAKGGTGSIVRALEKLMNEENITILKGRNVTQLLTTGKRVTSVELDHSEQLKCDHVVCNSDPPNVYKNLIKSHQNYGFFFKTKVKRMDYSMGLFVYYFGSNKKYDDVEHHTIVFGHSHKSHLEKIFNQKILSDDISYYLHRPSKTDPSMAPDGKDVFYVLVPVPNNLSGIDWSEKGEALKDLVLTKMDESVLPGIKSHVTADFFVTPDYFENDLSTLHGSGFSIQPKFSQSAYFRFHNKSEIFENLFFVGAGTHPGAGLPGVLSTSKVLEKLV